MSDINQHDIVTKQVLTQKSYAVDFLKNALPSKITLKLDFSKLKVEKGSFIDAGGKERFTDILYSIPMLLSTGRELIGVYCLLEHKAYPDKDIYAQLLLYLAGIYKDRKWPVIPLVLYHGKKEWDLPLDFVSSLSIPDELKNELERYIPDFQYELLDLRADKTDITFFSVALQAFLKTLQEIWYLSDRKKLETIFRDYFRAVAKGDEKLLDILFHYIIVAVSRLDIELVAETAEQYISAGSGGKVMTIAEELEKRGIEKGRAEGKAEGKTEGKAEVALGMLREGLAVETISKCTGLSVGELEVLKEENRLF